MIEPSGSTKTEMVLAKSYSNVDNVSMTEIVNLNKVRKHRAKQAKLKSACQNRVKFGMSRQEREATRRDAEKQAEKIDAIRLPADLDPES